MYSCSLYSVAQPSLCAHFTCTPSHTSGRIVVVLQLSLNFVQSLVRVRSWGRMKFVVNSPGQEGIFGLYKVRNMSGLPWLEFEKKRNVKSLLYFNVRFYIHIWIPEVDVFQSKIRLYYGSHLRHFTLFINRKKSLICRPHINGDQHEPTEWQFRPAGRVRIC